MAGYILFLFGLMCVYLCAAEYSWCDPDLCAPGNHHIACQNNGGFSEHCQADTVALDITDYKSVFVSGHNKRRNAIAMGRVPGYDPAAHMSTMVWDDELEYLAALNLRTCVLDHDECHNTYRFKNSGQNLCAIYRDRSLNVNITSLIEQTLNLWFDEYPLIDNTYIASFRVTKSFENYGHFAEMVVDRNTHVGCGIIRFTRPDFPYLYIYNVVCNYGSIYALDTPVYTKGLPASLCSTGNNPLYPGLCSTREEFDPNY